MGNQLLPLFPLDHVLMPGCTLSLRIFEPRYRTMLTDVRAEGAEPRLAEVGTLAQILEVQPLSDGTISVFTGGSSRFRIERLVDSGSPYLVAEVTWLQELDGTVPANLPGATRALAAEYSRLVHAYTGVEDHPDSDDDALPADASLLSYRLASEAPLTQQDKQQLLEDETAAARLLHVQRVLRRELVLLRATRSVAVTPAMLHALLRLD